VRALLSLGRATGDISYYERARDICARIGDAVRLSRAWNGIGKLHHAAGRHHEAIECYRSACEAFVDVPCLLNMGLAYQALGAPEAFSCFDQAAELALRLRDKELLADAARLLHEAKFVEQALRRMRQAERLYLTAEDESP
jgi:tetratricopeptide (TPR) repeat protein